MKNVLQLVTSSRRYLRNTEAESGDFGQCAYNFAILGSDALVPV